VRIISNPMNPLPAQPSAQAPHTTTPTLPRITSPEFGVPQTHAFRTQPSRAPPPAPTNGPRGLWRVGGYTAQKQEILTYHPHTHTPITKPHARRLESIDASPWPASASHERRHVSLADPNNHTYPSWSDNERAPLQSPDLKDLHTYPQPPAPSTSATSSDFWMTSQTPVLRDDDADAILPPSRRCTEGTKPR
jgi:hypothetical protein